MQQLNQRYKEAEETNLNQDIQIEILRQEIKAPQTNDDSLKKTQISVYAKLRYLQKRYHNLQMQLDAIQGQEQLVSYHAGLLKNIGSGDKLSNGENTLQSPLTHDDVAGTHHNGTVKESHRVFTNDPSVINGQLHGGLKSDGQLHKSLKSVRYKILVKSPAPCGSRFMIREKSH